MRYHFDTTQEVCADVHAERRRQQELIDKGKIPWDMCDIKVQDELKVGVLGEEFGEVCKAIVERQGGTALYEELIQTAAVAIAWAESIPEELRN